MEEGGEYLDLSPLVLYTVFICKGKLKSPNELIDDVNESLGEQELRLIDIWSTDNALVNITPQL